MIRRPISIQDLTPTEVAAIRMEIAELNSGEFSSEVEMKSYIRSIGYSLRDSMGEQFRAAFDSKAMRTQQHYSILGNNKVSNQPTHATQAGAVRNPDGSVSVGILEPGNQSGEIPTPEVDRRNTFPKVEEKPGGVLSVRIAREQLGLIKPDPEAQARREQIERSKNNGTPIRSLPLIKKPQ